MIGAAGIFLPACSDDVEMPANPDAPQAVKPVENDVIYQVNPRFYGTQECLKAVTADLDRIASTGTTILWIMPVNTPGSLNSVGSPYCVRDFKGLNPKYGTDADLTALINAAHQRGMKVILDWIANHTAWDCAWVTEHPDWYTKDADGNIISPAGTGWNDVADLNYDNGEMRRAMIDAMLYWVNTFHIDGYRCDHVDGVPFDFWTNAIAELRQADSDLFMLAESSDSQSFAAGFDMTYGWPFGSDLKNLYGGKNDPTKFFNESASEMSTIPEGRRVMRYALNHDVAAETSVRDLYGSQEGMMGAQVLAMMLDGTPMIYDAQEIDYSGTISFFDYSKKTFSAAKTAELKAIADAYKATALQRSGELTTYSAGKAVMFSRAVGDKTVLVIVNPTSSALTVKTPIALAGETMIDGIAGVETVLPVAVNLDGYGYMVMYK